MAVLVPLSKVLSSLSSLKCPAHPFPKCLTHIHLQCAISNVPCAPACPAHQRALRTNVPYAPMCPMHQRALCPRTNVPYALISVLIAHLLCLTHISQTQCSSMLITHLLCLTHISLKPNALQDTPSYFPYSTLSGSASLAAYFVAKYSLLPAPILIPARYTGHFRLDNSCT